MYVYVTIFLPAAIVNWYLSLVMVGLNWRSHGARNLFACLLLSLSAYTISVLVPSFHIGVLANILIPLFVIKALCHYSWKSSLIVSLFYSTLILAKEEFFIFFLDVFSIVSTDSLMEYAYSLEKIARIHILFCLLTLFVGLVFSFLNLSLSRWIHNQHHAYRRLAENICILLLIMLLTILCANAKFMQIDLELYRAVSFVVFVILITGVSLIVSFAKKMENQSVTLVETVYLDNMHNLLNLVRSQRHDHINHIYVLSHLLQAKKFEEATEYLGEYCSEIRLVQNLLNINHLPLACLLQSKAEIAIQSCIQIEFDIRTVIPKINMKSYELIQVIGNLLDNAIEEEKRAVSERRYLKFSVEQMQHTMLVFKVNNANSYIPAEMREAIFQEGCSSKENHAGIGLAIVKKLTLKYQGHVEVESTKHEGTTFYIFLPVAL
ncbi:sensor histidine kinase [Brevibacillus parabrevis]|uniref:sensor histidine kinase n=1 Tax=Brevibacillus parabrevis TaxID=54914 RepID=UPI002E1CBC24|nr:GHKL domain-containing protein [Brevibacillus parabrevis]